MNVTDISRHELQTKLSSRAPLVLLEALPAPYFERGHLPGARNLPHDQVRRLAATVAPEKTAEIVVYCASATCQNSRVAAGALAGLGYENVRVFRGGKQEWQEAGLALEGVTP
jgi:rhodanese-related sulfurtransferase